MYVALSGWNSARICDTTRGQLSIDFVHRFSICFYFSWISIVLLIKFNHKCMHIHLRPNIPKYKRRGKMHFPGKWRKKNVYSSIRQLYCCDITDIRRVPPERATYTKVMKPLKIISLDWIIQICPNFCCYRFLKSSSIHPICINAWGSFSFKQCL